MPYLLAAIAGLVLGAIGAFIFGLGATQLMTAVGGARSGGSAMSGFFIFGPIGLLAGGLLGAGLVLRQAGAATGLTRVIIPLSLLIAVIGVVLCVLNIAFSRGTQ